MRIKFGSRMKVYAGGVFVTCAAVVWSAAAGAQPEDSGCSVLTLRGNYGGSFEGQIAAGQLRGLVWTHFDGGGNLIQREFVTINGFPPSSTWRSAQGTYELAPDCTGRAEIIQGDGTVLRQRWVVVNRGREIRAIVEGAAAGGTRIKID
jgi:hypothetical protein